MDMSLYLRAAFALVAVLGLIVLAAWAARRAPAWRLATFGAPAGPPRRLGVTERISLDPRRQVVILRDGSREHVILLGLTNETVLESRCADAAAPPLRLVDPGSNT